MALPLAFLAGLLVLFANRELAPPIPGSGTAAHTLPFLLLLALPSALAALARSSMRRELVRARRGLVPPRALLRLSAASTAIVLHVLSTAGAYGDFVDRLAGDSHLGGTALLLLPLLAAELPRLVLATRAVALFEVDDEVGGTRSVPPHLLPRWSDVRPVLRVRLGWPLLLVMPLVLLGACLDALQTNRAAYTFFLTTSPGSTLAAATFLVLAGILLPPWFRIAFGTSRALPEPTGAQLRDTAARLGFAPRNVLLLPTGMRAMNAMMVGPLPVGRCLCVTDGLLRALDAESLCGVVAHEVGHAKRGHPGILMTLAVVVPLLLASPARFLDLEGLASTTQVLVGAVAALLLWSLVRSLAHRFEHEADAASVQALGAGPCTRALMVVSQLAVPVAHGFLGRAVSLHPEESRRWTLMRRYETEPAFRAAFEARGRQLRLSIALLFFAALVAASWAWVCEWPFERAIWRFRAGDFASAHRLASGLEAPPRWQKTWERFREELDAAYAVAPTASTWAEAVPALRAHAWRRGVEALVSTGSAAARPWFMLAVEAAEPATDVQRLVAAYCDAAADDETERVTALREALRARPLPPELRPVFQ